MSVAGLREVLEEARNVGQAVAGLVVLGWEDIGAFVAAGEAQGAPIILQAGPSCRKHTPLSVLGAMFRYYGERASVPVVCHLDHGYELAEVREAIDAGFTSVMIDGSSKSLSENIDMTSAAVEIAKAHGVSVEGEIGFVGYDTGEASSGTDPEEAEKMAQETKVDALAVSVGNTHLQTSQSADIDEGLLADIAKRVACPLVLHGGSGIPGAVRGDLARKKLVQKFNIGTELRQVFGEGLRAHLASHPDDFDRLSILSAVHAPLCEATERVIASLR